MMQRHLSYFKVENFKKFDFYKYLILLHLIVLNIKLIEQFIVDNDIESVEKHLSSEIINSKNNDGRTPLMIACKEGKYSIIYLLIENHADLNMQDNDGNTALTHSIAAGLDYIGIGPELARLHDTGRVQFERILDIEALDGVATLARTEGIIPALESAHAVAYVMKNAKKIGKNAIVIINMSGRGDKDVTQMARLLKL